LVALKRFFGFVLIRGGFLPTEDRTDLIALARDGSVA
jgi:hypothetical protein